MVYTVAMDHNDQNEEQGGGLYSEDAAQHDEDNYYDADAEYDGPVIEWEAPEYIHHDKSNAWFVGFGFIVVAAVAAIYLLTNEWGLDDWLLVVLVLIMATAVVVYANRRPGILQYSLDREGLQVGEFFYPLQTFRSFSFIEEANSIGVELMPLGRFRPPLSIYFSEQIGEEILNLLSDFLPHEERQIDIVDRLVKKLRF